MTTALTKTACGAKNRTGGTCQLRAGFGTDHVGDGRCKFHGGKTPVRSGRYSTVKHERRPRAAPMPAPRLRDVERVAARSGRSAMTTALTKTACGAKNRTGGTCQLRAGFGTDHVGDGRCKFHGGKTPVRSGRYSTVKHEALRDLIAQHAADEDPLDILPELAAARALFQDFIERYGTFTEALLAWHASYETSGRKPLAPAKLEALRRALDEYEAMGELTDDREEDLKLARELAEQLGTPDTNKPRVVLDISDAYRIVGEITKIVERIEKIRAANAISRPELLRVMTEMGRVVQAHVTDEATQAKVRDGWLAIRL
jgi:hypothetical protein